jgi:hypothetical protein
MNSKGQFVVKIAEDLKELSVNLMKTAEFLDEDTIITEEELQKTAGSFAGVYDSMNSAEMIKFAGQLLGLAAEKSTFEAQLAATSMDKVAGMEQIGLYEAMEAALGNNFQKEAGYNPEVDSVIRGITGY